MLLLPFPARCREILSVGGIVSGNTEPEKCLIGWMSLLPFLVIGRALCHRDTPDSEVHDRWRFVKNFGVVVFCSGVLVVGLVCLGLAWMMRSVRRSVYGLEQRHGEMNHGWLRRTRIISQLG